MIFSIIMSVLQFKLFELTILFCNFMIRFHERTISIFTNFQFQFFDWKVSIWQFFIAAYLISQFYSYSLNYSNSQFWFAELRFWFYDFIILQFLGFHLSILWFRFSLTIFLLWFFLISQLVFRSSNYSKSQFFFFFFFFVDNFVVLISQFYYFDCPNLRFQFLELMVSIQ